jgi:hypothetical protein
VSAGAVMGPVDVQLESLREVFPGATAALRTDGTTLVTVPDIPLSTAWNARTTTVVFMAPAGYPMAQPDCFWADSALRLAEGAMPQSSNISAIPGDATLRLWFSWHLSGRWNPLTDTLLTYVRVIQQRLLRGN